MTNLITKSTIYDAISIIIPGYLFLLCIYAIFKEYCGLKDLCYNQLPSIIIWFVLSYLVGLCVHHLSKKIFDPLLRNKEKHIKREKERVEEDIQKRENGDKTVDLYYQKYYRLLGNSHIAIPILEAQVSFIRSMLIIIPIAIIAILCSGNNSYLFPMPNCCAILLLLILEMISYKLLCVKQREIYYHVFEDSYYMKRRRRY